MYIPTHAHLTLFYWLYVTVPNPNVPNAKMPTRHSAEHTNIPMHHSAEHTNISTRHSAEHTNIPNFNMPNRQIVDFSLETQPVDKLLRICSNKSQPIGLLFLVTILPLGAYLG
jgi:hypothetical protein